jgi:hypothetical protein
MHRKTIRLEDSYHIAPDGQLMVLTSESGEWVSRPSRIQVGAEMTLVSSERLSGPARGAVVWHLHQGPVAGNSDHRLAKYHGWRGTTDDVFVEAHGVRRVLRIRALRNRTVAVTVGDDLHPDWP